VTLLRKITGTRRDLGIATPKDSIKEPGFFSSKPLLVFGFNQSPIFILLQTGTVTVTDISYIMHGQEINGKKTIPQNQIHGIKLPHSN
jgi:hypothetical protein